MESRVSSDGSRLTTLRLRRAARSALSGACTPYQIGGCGFCSGSISIGTPLKENRRPLKSSTLWVSPLEHELDRLRVDLLRVLRIDAVIFELDGRGTAAEAEFEASAAQLVEHADFLDQPQRVVERHRPDQRTEPKLCRALRHGGKEHARRGRHAERRRVVLGEMVRVEPRAIIGLCDFQAILVIVRERAAMTIEVIEDTEFHFLSAPSLASHWLWRQPILIICAGEATMMIGAYCAVEPSRSFSRPTASTSCVQRATSLRMKSLTCAGA